MNQAAQTVMKTAAVGVVLGTAAGIMMNSSHKKSRQIKKKAAHAMKTVGTMFNSISQMM